MPTLAFATFLIVCPTAFFLGILFSLFPYDYPLLWASGSPTESHLLQTEAHLRLLHASPALIVRILHTMIFLGLAGLITKLYKPSESNMLFDGGSLVLYMCGIVVYVANIVKGLRIATQGTYGSEELENTTRAGREEDPRQSVVGREDNLKVLSASNTILALVLVGVLILQAGQWYAERAEEKEKVNMREQEERERLEREKEEAEEAAAAVAPVGRRVSQREAKKSR
ncbi:hypothetical protein GJ744_006625 [Endocarpon pusillum]|uniref:Secretory component protein shr3 n=1 Tax=Endocarpon pusillum TaxID=364733 RepID=A0A8H7AW15_9EURO|nr:hypothetical protein GJ744_006625 [Endocarpon pusillum]